MGEHMGLKERFDADMTEAMRAKDALKLSVLRMIKTALRHKEVEKRRPLEESEILALLNTLIKQRQDSVEQFERGNRMDLADKERREIEIIRSYMPAPLRREEIAAAVDEAMRQLGATSAADFGRVMKTVMAKLADRGVDGRAVSEIVRERLPKT